MVNWKDLIKRLPAKVQVARNRHMEILWTHTVSGDGDTLGEMRPDKNQIVLKTDETAKETIHTYIHELLHAVSDQYDAGLTEKQVRSLEKAIYYMLKPGNIFKGD